MIENKNSILIDTNGLITSIKYHIDIFYELNLLGYKNFFILQSVIYELKVIIQKKKSENNYAKIAIQLIKNCNIIECRGYTDDLIFNIAKKLQMIKF